MAGIVTNSGLDNFCGYNSVGFGTDNTHFNQFAAYAAVTADSTPITQTSAALIAEIARTSSDGGFTASKNYVAAGNTITFTGIYTRVLNFASAQNLAAWGLFAVSSGGNMSAGDLFRDGTNTPVSVPILAGGQLQLTITLTYAVALWGATALNLNIAGIGVVPGSHTLWSSTNSIQSLMLLNAHPYPYSLIYLNSTFDAAPSNSNTGPNINSNGGPQITLNAYTVGSYQRSRQATFSTSQSVGNITGLLESGTSTPGVIDTAYKFIPTAPISKLNTQQLTIVTTWSVTRA